MRIIDIKNKANSLLIDYEKIFKVILYVGLLNVVISTLSNQLPSFLGMILSILTLTVGHGCIVASLKTVNNMQDQIEPMDDAFIGFIKIKKLFSTYFIYQIILLIIVAIICFVGGVIVMTMIGKTNLTQLYQLILTVSRSSSFDSTQLVQMMQLFGNSVSVIYLFMIIVVTISVIYSLQFGLYPYILEKYNIKGVAALKESSRLMKGHKWTLFKLQLSFIGWMMLSSLVVALFMNVFSMLIPSAAIISGISSVLGVFVETYLFNMKLNVCLAVFYEELDYFDKNGQNENEGESL